MESTRYRGFRLQPYRVAKIGKATRYAALQCLTVGAFETFRKYACMSLEPYDIEIYETWLEEYSLGELGDGTKYASRVNKSGIFGNLFEWMKTCENYRYVIIRVHVPNHIAVLMWDRKNNRIELFDSGGIYEFSFLIEDAVWYLFNGAYIDEFNILIPDLNSESKNDLGLPKDITFITVNQENLQVLDEDIYCQTWIYFYVYMRLIKGYSYKKLNKFLATKSPKEKLEMIEEFWRFLIEQ